MDTIDPNLSSELKVEIQAELEATRLAFHTLAREIPDSLWGEKCRDSAWTVKEEMWHITWGTRFMLDLIHNCRRGIGLPTPPMFIADRLNAIYSQLRATFATPHSILQRFDKTHTDALELLESIQDDEWQTAVRILGKVQTIKDLFFGISHHFEEHAARIRPVLEEHRIKDNEEAIMTPSNQEVSLDPPGKIAEKATTASERPEKGYQQRIEVHHRGVQDVKAEHVEVHQGGVQFIEAKTATLDKSGSLTLNADHVIMNMSGAGILTSKRASMQKDSSAGLIVANQVEGPQINTRLLLAGQVHGNVNTAIDARRALLIGLGLGIGLGLLFSLKSLVEEKN